MRSVAAWAGVESRPLRLAARFHSCRRSQHHCTWGAQSTVSTSSRLYKLSPKP